MKKNWNKLLTFHTSGEISYMLGHCILMSWLNDNPDASHAEYEKKAKSQGINYMSEESFVLAGFGWTQYQEDMKNESELNGLENQSPE